MSMFTLDISCLTTSNLPWFMDLHSRFLCNIALYSIGLYFHHQSHPHWVLFLLWLHLFILSGVISPLISSSILGIYWPGEFIFQCHIFLSFHTVHGVLKARVVKQFDIPFSGGWSKSPPVPQAFGEVASFSQKEFSYFFWSFIHLLVLSTHFGGSL